MRDHNSKNTHRAQRNLWACQVPVPGRPAGSGSSATRAWGLAGGVDPVGFAAGVGECSVGFDRVVFHRMDSQQFAGL